VGGLRKDGTVLRDIGYYETKEEEEANKEPLSAMGSPERGRKRYVQTDCQKETKRDVVQFVRGEYEKERKGETWRGVREKESRSPHTDSECGCRRVVRVF